MQVNTEKLPKSYVYHSHHQN